MGGHGRSNEGCHQFLDLMEKESDTTIRTAEVISHGLSEEQKLELRLGPPGGDWCIRNNSETEHQHVYAHGFFSKRLCSKMTILTSPCQEKTGVLSSHLESANLESQQANLLSLAKESSQRLIPGLQNPEKKLLQPAPANTAVPNCSGAQKRTSPTPVVGWPPIRTFRKNLATGSSSKLAPQPTDTALISECRPPLRNMFVKINMDGVPIGRKIDIRAYDSYEKLSKAVDELFRDLLAAQGRKCNEDGSILDREYTLVYEDNEGDRMLVGDLPWPMFASTVKRLRVLKTTELPKLQSGGKQRGKLPCVPK